MFKFGLKLLLVCVVCLGGSGSVVFAQDGGARSDQSRECPEGQYYFEGECYNTPPGNDSVSSYNGHSGSTSSDRGEAPVGSSYGVNPTGGGAAFDTTDCGESTSTGSSSSRHGRSTGPETESTQSTSSSSDDRHQGGGSSSSGRTSSSSGGSGESETGDDCGGEGDDGEITDEECVEFSTISAGAVTLSAAEFQYLKETIKLMVARERVDKLVLWVQQALFKINGPVESVTIDVESRTVTALNRKGGTYVVKVSAEVADWLARYAKFVNSGPPGALFFILPNGHYDGDLDGCDELRARLNSEYGSGKL